MATKQELAQLRSEFAFLRKSGKVLAVLMFGSRVGKPTKRSDTDICIVAPDADPKTLLRQVHQNVDVHGKKYEVYLFEELPLHIQIEIIKKHKQVYVQSELDLSEYFYRFRKLWAEQAHRQKVSKRELIRML